MTRKDIAQILDCSSSLISRVLKDHKNNSLRAQKIKRLIQLNFELQEVYLESLFYDLCELVINKASQKQWSIVAHACDCLRIRTLLQKKNAEKEGKEVHNTRTNAEELVSILDEGNNVLEKKFLDDKFVTMCEIVLSKAKNSNLKKFAGDMMYLSMQLRSKTV